MVSHSRLSDNKTPQVSRTLLSILTDLNKTLFWVVSFRPLIPSPLVPVPIFGQCTKSTSYYWYNRLFHVCPTVFVFFFFISLARSRYLSFSSLSSVFLGGQPGQWSLHFFFTLLILRLVVLPKVGDLFYLKIPEDIVRYNFQNGFWVMHIPFIRMVKFQFIFTVPSESPCPPSKV